MVDGINGTSVAPSVTSSLNVTNSNTDDSRKTSDVKEEERNDRVTLSTQKTDSTQSSAPREEKTNIESEEAVRQASESSQNELPGTRVDILT
ncbi:unnamed protein product [marine sediment metagenome]|uniref:Uncharacterized protein n=1 Tax=marine sediment metagenome TaxID=412755 RepID=X1RAH5_9ZZZZ